MGKFTGILTIIFVIAKIVNLIAWSWWLVFLPAILYVLAVLFGCIFIFVLHVIESTL